MLRGQRIPHAARSDLQRGTADQRPASAILSGPRGLCDGAARRPMDGLCNDVGDLQLSACGKGRRHPCRCRVQRRLFQHVFGAATAGRGAARAGHGRRHDCHRTRTPHDRISVCQQLEQRGNRPGQAGRETASRGLHDPGGRARAGPGDAAGRHRPRGPVGPLDPYAEHRADGAARFRSPFRSGRPVRGKRSRGPIWSFSRS